MNTLINRFPDSCAISEPWLLWLFGAVVMAAAAAAVMLLITVIYRLILAVAGKAGDENEHRERLLSRINQSANLIFDTAPFSINIWNNALNLIYCNQAAVNMFLAPNNQAFVKNFFVFSPERQSDGRSSEKAAISYIKKAFEEGYCHAEWMHRTFAGELVPSEITFVRVNIGEDFVVAYIRDLREDARMMRMIEASARENKHQLSP